jgi:FkbM family methyltransferase
MRIYYGIVGNLIDVTDICIEKLKYGNIIIIPNGDMERAKYFTDPIYGVMKKIFIEKEDGVFVFESFHVIQIDLENKTISYADVNTLQQNTNSELPENYLNRGLNVNDPDYKVKKQINEKLIEIHTKINLKHGKMNDEIPEQKMVVRYLKGKEKVLEIGSNIGRNTLVIASILEDDRNLVTMECDPVSEQYLRENRDVNRLNFHIEGSALSKRKLIQKGWDTKPSEILEKGYSWVNTITLSELRSKYNVAFDTLVLDCEGAFYYILMDMPEILEGVNLIIMENDYHEIEKKNYVDSVLREHKFNRDYVEGGGWGPCENRFFEVWKK